MPKQEQTEARRPLDVFGIGRSARSSIVGVAAFALRDPNDDPAAAGPADYEGNAIDLADEARTFLVHRTFEGTKDGHVLVGTPDGEVLRLRVAPALSDAGYRPVPPPAAMPE